jgi:S1 RNA binding domain protein
LTSIEVGTILEGVVSGITSFGAFVTLPGNVVGLVHISEVADVYVRDVKDFLKEQDKVLVKVINIDPKGKIGLSVKQAKPLAAPPPRAAQPAAAPAMRRDRPSPRPAGQSPRGSGFSSQRSAMPESFEDKLSKFIKESDQKQMEFRRSTDAKRGGRGAGRS